MVYEQSLQGDRNPAEVRSCKPDVMEIEYRTLPVAPFFSLGGLCLESISAG